MGPILKNESVRISFRGPILKICKWNLLQGPILKNNAAIIYFRSPIFKNGIRYILEVRYLQIMQLGSILK